MGVGVWGWVKQLNIKRSVPLHLLGLFLYCALPQPPNVRNTHACTCRASKNLIMSLSFIQLFVTLANAHWGLWSCSCRCAVTKIQQPVWHFGVFAALYYSYFRASKTMAFPEPLMAALSSHRVFADSKTFV